MLDQPAGHVFEASARDALSPRQRLHLVLLGVASVERSTAFYEALGWAKSPTGNTGFAKFDLGGYALCLISRADLAKDAGFESPTGSGFAGMALIYIAQSPDEVPRILAKAVEAGGRLVKPATRTHWGVAGYFADPDGHLFEVDYEDVWVLDASHRLVVDQVNA
ncbi:MULTISPECIES: VOC family protein [unclassified Roseateles]|uniref:VOC family protein n=1 Tax=unclassified Roseateles TaxID=2626991 RepID=UPI0006F21727|nr:MULTISPECIES: VOC family protein [unclassified Roseateles]KQW42823.1 glyoxalase [Pelomonas sp. Root405]KRA69501.1 glyoxalase [Pelomonas sp. Root662]